MKKKIEILFIGNSLTYYNLLPLCVKKFFAGIGVEARCVMQTCGGKCLDYHCGRGDTEMNIKYGGFDYVVLQGKATGFDPEAFVPAGEKIIKDLIIPVGSLPVLYMAWSLRDDPAGQIPMTAAYEKLAELTGAILAPAGEAWHRALRIRPKPELYMPDGNHPTRAGTYLCAASVFYAITGRDRIIDVEENGFFSEYGLDRATAVKLNRIALREAARYRAK